MGYEGVMEEEAEKEEAEAEEDEAKEAVELSLLCRYCLWPRRPRQLATKKRGQSQLKYAYP